MNHDAFMAGVLPGGPNTDYEVRILICWLLKELGFSATSQQLNTALVGEGLVNYFELSGAIGQLLSTGHLIERIEEEPSTQMRSYFLELNDLGAKTADTFARELPRTVRDRSIAALRHCILQERFERENLVEIEETADGYCLTLAVRDVGNDLLRLSLYAPTKEVCETMKRNFISDPTVLYRTVVSSLMGESLQDLLFYGQALQEKE